MPGGSFPEAEERFGKLLALIETLRDPVSGCPWDIRQTKADVGRYLLEETCEVLDAVDRNSPAAMREELGDLLFMILFLARIAEEEKLFGIGDILDEITAKMIRRHPHVFGDAQVEDAAEVKPRRKKGKGLSLFEENAVNRRHGEALSPEEAKIALAELDELRRAGELAFEYPKEDWE